ncbi:hypothetical protein R3P38DRAFT_2607009 [Favolaschia claudopus]|uniref:F-box domain-containing protein n=1 Tax=Favolaschia claudopus TaxID=2862362 RepID=A0AAW0DCV8_9AGAR
MLRELIKVHPDRHIPRPVSAEEPLKFLQVCRLWREIAMTCPSLWTGIQINEPTDPQFYEACSNWLERARPLPLSISLHGFVDEPMEGLLKRFAGQIGRLQLYIPNDTSLYNVEQQGPFPSLQTITIRYSKEANEDSEMSDDSDSVDVFRDSIIDLLLAAPSMVECSFHLIQYATNLERDREVHTSLRHLRLGMPSAGYYPSRSSAKILLYLKLPALETLHLANVDISTGDFVSFFSESGCAATLQALHMTNAAEWPPFSRELLSLCFRPFAALKTLEFFHGDFIVLSEVLSSAQDLLPNLNHLLLHGYRYFGSRDNPSDWKALLDMLLSRGTARNGSLQSLKAVCMTLPTETDLDLEVLLRFRELVKEGMSIHIGTWYRNLI